MSKDKNKAYRIKEETPDELVLVKKVKHKDHNFVKLSIVLTDKQQYIKRAKDKTRQGQLVLDYLMFDIDYNKDTIIIDRQIIQEEMELSVSGVKRGITNLIKIGYIIKTKKRGEYLINSDLFFKGVRTKAQKDKATNIFNTYVDNRVFNLTTKEAVDRANELGFGITKHTPDKYIEIKE